MDDHFNLVRFVDAQNAGGIFDRAVSELRAGRKTGHWMWFIFPQVAGLGISTMSRHFAISGTAEARAYLDHPILGPRLHECAEIVAATPDRTARDIFGDIDAAKLRSSMTLFHRTALDEVVFDQVLDRFFDGVEDSETTTRL